MSAGDLGHVAQLVVTTACHFVLPQNQRAICNGIGIVTDLIVDVVSPFGIKKGYDAMVSISQSARELLGMAEAIDNPLPQTLDPQHEYDHSVLSTGEEVLSGITGSYVVSKALESPCRIASAWAPDKYRFITEAVCLGVGAVMGGSAAVYTANEVKTYVRQAM